MSARNPSLVVIAGPNGAGKSTIAPALLRDTLAVDEFVNADVIARGLSAFASDAAAVAAGRVMLQRLDELARSHVDFAFESTLASRSFVPWIAQLRSGGYRFHLVFLWLSSVELAVERVQHRVTAGGHAVPEETIRRRYDRGLRNFFERYRPLADRWWLYDNSDPSQPRRVASGEHERADLIHDPSTWKRITAQFEAH